MNALESLNPFFDSALASAMTAGSVTVETNIPLSAVVANSFAPSLPAERAAIVASVETSIPAAAVASNPELAEGPVVAPRQTESFAARLLGPGRKKDQASIPEPAPAPLHVFRAETPAGDTGETLVSSPAALSLDLRIHNVMLAVADELADEQRTINERLLLQQFAPQLRHT